MSPLWRDEVVLFLAPRRVVLARMKRGIRATNVAERNIIVASGDTASWESSLATLEDCLADEVWQHANLRLVIADHWARYAVVPWSDDLSGAQERIEHARLCMSNTFGDVVAHWTVTVSDSPPGLPQIACAIPTAMLDRLKSTFAARRLNLKSVQPQLIAAFNGWRNRLPRGEAWFVTLDEGSLSAAHVTPTHWDFVRSVRIGPDWEVELKRLRTLGRLLNSGEEAARVYVDAPRWVREKANGADQGVEWLDDATSIAESEGRFALLERLYA